MHRVFLGRSYPFLILATAIFAFSFSLGVSRTIQNNFWVDVLELRPDQMGLLITAREIPGFLTIVLAALTMRFAPSRLAGACFFVMAVGYSAYGLATSFGTIVPGVVFASLGFHLWITLNGAFGLAVAKPGEEGRVLGDLQSIGFIAGLVGMGGVFLVFDRIGFLFAFVISGAAMLVGTVAILRFPGEIVHRSPQRMVVRRRYRLFYALNFFEGCRFEFFQAFGIFLLVQHYALPVRTIAILFILSAVSSAVLSPVAGRLIDRWGERPILTFGYVVMLAAFLGFALWHDARAAATLYVVYNVVLVSEVGVNTYLKKVAAPEDVRPSLATGVTTMHVPALMVPILGGVLWNAFGFEVPFLVGVVFIGASLVATQLIPRHAPLAVAEMAGAS